jgi:predicted permease
MSTFLKDVQFALRWLRRSPTFVVAAVLTLALGIGANTAMFSIVNAVLLRSLPYPEPDRLVRIWSTNLSQESKSNVNPLDFQDWQKRMGTFAGLAGFAARRYTATGAGAEPERVTGFRVTSTFFPLLGADMEAGRAFNSADDKPGGPPVAVLSDSLWQRRFHRDAAAIGRSIDLDDTAYTIVGVTSPGFRPLTPLVKTAEEPEIWVPLRIETKMGRGGAWLNAFGRLRPGASVAAARSELTAVAAGLRQEYPATNKTRAVKVESLKESMVGDTRGPLLMLLASVGLVLLIACVNVANLLLARGSARRKELGIRAVLGASAWRLTGQLFTESLVMALAGGAVGVLLAHWLLHLLVGLRLLSLPGVARVGIDLPVLAFTFGLAVLTAFVFGLLPAVRGARTDLGPTLQEGVRGGDTAGGRGLPRALMVVEMALALVLLIGAGLLLRSFWHLLDVGTGFNPDRLLTAQIQLPKSRYGQPARRAAFFREIVPRAAALPGVKAASAVDILPFGGTFNCNDFTVDDQPASQLEALPCAEYRTVGPDYFATMGIALRQGRTFTDGDVMPGAPAASGTGAAAPPAPASGAAPAASPTGAPATAGTSYVAVVNEALARRVWPGRSAVGRRITLSFDADIPHQVIGVVADVRQFGLDKPVAPEVYTTYLQHPTDAMTLAIRTRSEPLAAARSLRGLVREMDSQLPLSNVAPMADLVSDSVAQQRLRTLLLTLFAVVATALAAVGVFGIMAYSVARRTHEIGVRMALGADRSAVLRLVLGQAMGATMVGVALGLGTALFATRLLRSFLFGVQGTDPVVLTASALVLVVVALLASYIPVRRALRLDPLTALRQS